MDDNSERTKRLSRGHDDRVDHVAKVIIGFLLTVCFAISSWSVSRIIDHGERLAVVETQTREYHRTLVDIKNQLVRLNQKIDRMDGR